MSDKTHWGAYYKATKNETAHPSLTEALRRFDEQPSDTPRFAVDLGCGAGRDTVELLKRGWRVLAVDLEEEGLEILKKHCPEDARKRLKAQCASFENAKLPECDLINASMSLPFLPAQSFDRVWSGIVAAIRPGGRFAGHFFGKKDSWNERGDVVTFTREEVEARLKPFFVEWFRERDEEGQTRDQQPKHWHVFGVVARKR